MKNSFILFFDQIETFKELSDEQAGILIKHIYRYAATNEEPVIKDPVVNLAFIIIKLPLDRNGVKYAEKCSGIKKVPVQSKKTYQEKLKDPRWQKKRLKILERDGWMCTNCGADWLSLHIHHKTYIKGRDPWEYEDEELSTLCEICHCEAS